jgi:hypothetical protein
LDLDLHQRSTQFGDGLQRVDPNKTVPELVARSTNRFIRIESKCEFVKTLTSSSCSIVRPGVSDMTGRVDNWNMIQTGT